MEKDPYDVFKDLPATPRESERCGLLDSTQVGALIYGTLLTFTVLILLGLNYLLQESMHHGSSQYVPVAPANAPTPSQASPRAPAAP
jgi:hypothetical protein